MNRGSKSTTPDPPTGASRSGSLPFPKSASMDDVATNPASMRAQGATASTRVEDTGIDVADGLAGLAALDVGAMSMSDLGTEWLTSARQSARGRTLLALAAVLLACGLVTVMMRRRR